MYVSTQGIVLHSTKYSDTSIIVKVNIDIGQRDAVGVKKTLKQKVVLDGVNVSDA